PVGLSVVGASIVAAPPIGAACRNCPLIEPAAVSIAVEPRGIDVAVVAAMMMPPIVVVPGMIPVAVGMVGAAWFVVTLGYGAAVDAVTLRVGTIVMDPTPRRDIAARNCATARHATA